MDTNLIQFPLGARGPYGELLTASLVAGLLWIFVVVLAGCNDKSVGSAPLPPPTQQPPPADLPPETPQNVSSVAGNGQVTLSWDQLGHNKSHHLYWATASGVTTGDGTRVPHVTSPYTHTNLVNGITHYYIITAVDEDGNRESPNSLEVQATPTHPFSGTLDTSFGGVGFVTDHNTAGGNFREAGEAIAIDTSGRILVTGFSWGNYIINMVIWRYHRNGTQDVTFGNNGTVIVSGGAIDYGSTIHLDPSGRIVVAGITWGLNYDMGIWRFHPDGTPDVSFGGGSVRHGEAAGGAARDRAYGLTGDASGRIIAVGVSHNGSNNDMVIWRYTEDGVLDSTFNETGYRVFDSGNGADEARAVSVDTSGRIVVAGFSGNTMSIWRFDVEGQPDPTFGGSGMVTYPNGRGYALALDASGRIVVAGDSSGHMTLWRYNEDGSPDSTFGDNGLKRYDSVAAGFFGSIGSSLAMDPFGRITVAGEGYYEAQPYIDREMVVWRFLGDGTPDAYFSGDGVAIFNSGGTSVNGDLANAIAIDHAWHPVVTGFIGTGFSEFNDDDLAIWRYIP